MCHVFISTQALFRAGDSDDDGLVTYDDFINLVALVGPDIPEQQVTKMYREALQAGGGEMVRRCLCAACLCPCLAPPLQQSTNPSFVSAVT
eukprot:scaffold58189_cov39-Prasinocladus_malaysianus.AAC.1